jgi:hypothetical protein
MLMRVLIVSWFVLAISAGGVLAQGTAKDPKATTETRKPTFPKLHFDKLVYDFGQTSMVQSLTGTFTFSNAGDGVLELRRPTTSCGCTIAAVKPEKLEAGQKGELVFTLSVAGMTRGKVEKQITVPSNDPLVPAAYLTIKAELVSNYEIAPFEVIFGDLRAGNSAKFPVIIKRLDGKSLQIANTQPSSDLVQARVEPLTDYAGTAARVWVEVKAVGAPRRVAENVTLIGDDAQQVAVIPVTGRIVGDVSVAPESVFWGINDPANWPGAFPELMTKRKMSVVLTQAGGTLELRNPTTTLPDMEVNIVPVEPGKSFDVVAVLKQPPKETIRGTITLETNIPSQPQIVVPVLINVLQRHL